MDHPEIIVTDRTRASKYLMSKMKGGHLRYIVSIGGGDRKNAPPYGFSFSRLSKLRLDFEDDIYDTPVGPKRDHIERLIAFLERVDGPILIHCYAGVSRSTAAAYILLLMWYGPGKEMEAAEKLLEIRPQADPNPQMLQYAEEILGRTGFWDTFDDARENASL